MYKYLVVAPMLVQQRYNRFDVSLFDYVQRLRTLHQHTVKHLQYTWQYKPWIVRVSAYVEKAFKPGVPLTKHHG